MKTKILILTALLLSCFCGEIDAQKKSKPIVEGVFSEWRDLIDYIDIKKVFNINDYSNIYIAPIGTEAIQLPDKSDNTYEPTVTVLAQSSALSAGYMKKPFKKRPVTISTIDDIESVRGTKALVFKMKFDEFDAGNRALRVWVGFGAGNAGATMSGDVIDAETGDILISFRHRRIAPMNASSHDKVLKTLLQEVNEDLAKMLLQFQ